MTTDLPLRRLRTDDEDEVRRFAGAVARHFYDADGDDDVRPWLPMLATCAAFVVEDDTTGATPTIVGNWASLPLDVSLPGGARLPCAGVTTVGVSQLHRRRGSLRRLMTAGLDDAVERGQPVAGLFASESAIYPRFGFGVTAPTRRYHIDATRLRFVDPVDPALVVELPADEAVDAAIAVHEQVRDVRGGAVSRTRPQWELALVADPPAARGGASPKRRVHVPGRGYATYRVLERSDGALPDGEATVLELVAADPEAEQALWQHVTSLDLVTTVRTAYRPPDDGLVWQVEDRLRLRASEGAPLYLRILDVVRCLASRTSAVTDGFVLEVVDASRDQSGTYRWDLSPEGAACSRTDAPADVSLSIEALAALWLGGTAPSQLAAARRLREHRPGAVARLDAAVATGTAPWTPWQF